MSKVMRSDNLKNHVNTHGKAVEAPTILSQPLVAAGKKRPISSNLMPLTKQLD